MIRAFVGQCFMFLVNTLCHCSFIFSNFGCQVHLIYCVYIASTCFSIYVTFSQIFIIRVIQICFHSFTSRYYILVLAKFYPLSLGIVVAFFQYSITLGVAVGYLWFCIVYYIQILNFNIDFFSVYHISCVYLNL